MSTPRARDPQGEARELLGGDLVARVLEPSPPADTSDEAYLADDPTDPSGADGPVVSPCSDGDVTWGELAKRDAQIAQFARVHWLGPRRRLTRLPVTFAATRDAIHQLAYFAIAPRRHAATGKLGLRYTRGGLGTPFFEDGDRDQQVRFEGHYLIVQQQGGATGGDEVDWTTPTTVRDACEFLGLEYDPDWFADFHDPLDPADPDAELQIDGEASFALGDWFGFTTAVLEELRRTDGAQDVGRVQLWPEHLDPAVELGSADAEQRASYGASPGDADHAGPYLYVSPWSGHGGEEYWNDDSFGGASLSYDELLDAADQYEVALAFLRRGHELLTLA